MRAPSATADSPDLILLTLSGVSAHGQIDPCRGGHLMKPTDMGENAMKFTTKLDRDDVRGRILERTRAVGDCIEWTGYAMPSGYGIIHWRGKSWVVHRAMWTVEVGPIPADDDWTIDHLCLNKLCVNVRHLEVVTRTENSLRAGGLARAQGRNKQRAAMQCRNGHERTDENTGRNRDGTRYCRDCKHAAWERTATRTSARRRAQYASARAAGHSWQDASRVNP